MSEVLLSHALRTAVLGRPSLELDSGKRRPCAASSSAMLPAKTRLLGLPVLNNLDEGTVPGNIEVVKTYTEFLGIKNEPFCKDKIVPIAADAFTISHLRSAMVRRALDRSVEPHFDQQSAVSARILCDKRSRP
ncbi:hypothetical protein V8E36_002681 [Tilletia maclaganii]